MTLFEAVYFVLALRHLVCHLGTVQGYRGNGGGTASTVAFQLLLLFLTSVPELDLVQG
jgi:hypothetical protein